MIPISAAAPLVLGSASPRRKQLLETLGLPLVVLPANVPEEPLPGETWEAMLRRLTLDKLNAVVALCAQRPDTVAAVVAADTVVVVDDAVLGKPDSVAHAKEMLSHLVGRVHQVRTCYAVALPTLSQPPLRVGVVSTDVEMRSATDSELERYANTGEGLDKAGAYAVQGIGSFLVCSVRGSYANVVGLPVCELVSDLIELGLLVDFPLNPAPNRAARTPG